MKVLIAYDGSPCADSAINDLASAGLPENTQAMVLTVADVWPHMPGMYREAMVPGPSELSMSVMDTARRMAEQSQKEADGLARDAADRVAKAFPSWGVSAQSVPDSPAHGIIVQAGQWKADLIVVGSHGRGALGRMFFGSVSQKVVKYAPCSVRVARCPEHRQAGPLRIMIGMDTSDDSAAAISAVAQRHWPRQTVVHLVTALDVRLATALPAIELPVVDLTLSEDPQDWLEHAQQQAAEELRAAGLAVTTLVKEGDPKHVLLEEAEAWHADSLFLGAKGTTRIERFILGSVSAALTARAHCSVEVIRFGE
jgi:nucleotide-binding universal stress UspA family protein